MTALLVGVLENSGFRFERDERGWFCWDTLTGTVYGPYKTLAEAADEILKRYEVREW